MERKHALDSSATATFSSNERWFIAKLGRDVWKHGVLEFLLPSRRTQFRRAWFLGVVWYYVEHHFIVQIGKTSESYALQYPHYMRQRHTIPRYIWASKLGPGSHRFAPTNRVLDLTRTVGRDHYVHKLFPF